MANLENLILRDIAANRPAAGVAGRLFYDTTNSKWQRDTGATWEDCEPTGLPPSGSAGGDLSGTYPSPTVAKIGGVAVTVDTDGTLAANSDAKLATQKAVKTYVDTSVTGLLDFKGSTDCSTNPNYPAASKGDTYIVSVAGKIGGASGKTVDAGDVFIASADNAGGTEASVGTSWFVIEHNLLTGGGSDTTAIHDNESGEISAITEKTTLHNDDLFLIEDSEASNVKKKVKKSNVGAGSATYPEQVIVPVLYPSSKTGDFGPVQDTSQSFNFLLQQTTPAQNDYLEYLVLLQAGTWRVDLFGAKGATRAIATLSLDAGATSIGTLDFYNAATQRNQTMSLTGVSVASTGVKNFRLTAATKNASSSNWYMTFGFIVWTKTG